MQEYKINDLISLKLEDGKTIIYVGGQRFKQCAKLVYANTVEELSKRLNEITSIDQLAELESQDDEVEGLSSTEEFRAHCSNLQAWAESGYDPNLLHSNLAFPLLKELGDHGDEIASRMFKEAIVRRYAEGTENTRKFLVLEGYMDYLSKDEVCTLVTSQTDYEALFRLEDEVGQTFYVDYDIFWDCEIDNAYVVQDGQIVALRISHISLETVPEALQLFSHVERLWISHSPIRIIPNWFGNLISLRELYFKCLEIETLPESVGNLANLEKMKISESHNFSTLPENIGNLIKLTYLLVCGTRLNKVPYSIGQLKSLISLELFRNKLKSIPDSIGQLKSLQTLDIQHNEIESIPDTVLKLPKLKRIDKYGNKIPHS